MADIDVLSHRYSNNKNILDEIKNITKNEYLSAKDIAKKLGISVDNIEQILQVNSITKTDLQFNCRNLGGIMRYKLKPMLRIDLVEELTKKDIDKLLGNGKFVTFSDIVIKAICNAGRFSYDEAKDLGRRLTYYCYIMREHEAKAWDVKRKESTLLEKRLEILDETSGEKENVLISILKHMRRKKEADIFPLEIIDNILTTNERQEIYDFAIPTGVVFEAGESFLLPDGKEWRYHTFELDEKRIMNFSTDLEYIFRDVLNKTDYRHVIDLLIKKGDSEDWQDEHAKMIIKKLKDFNLLKFVQDETFVYTKKERMILSPKVLKYNSYVLKSVLEDCRREGLDILSRFNFDIEELKNLRIDTIENLEAFANSTSVQTVAKLPVFFNPDYSLITKDNFKHIVLKIHNLPQDSAPNLLTQLKLKKQGKLEPIKPGEIPAQTREPIKPPELIPKAISVKYVAEQLVRAGVTENTDRKTVLDILADIYYKQCKPTQLSDKHARLAAESRAGTFFYRHRSVKNIFNSAMKLAVADVALAVKIAGIKLDDDERLLEFVSSLYVKNGLHIKTAKRHSYNFKHIVHKNPGKLDELAQRGYFPCIQNLLPESVKTIDDVIESAKDTGKQAQAEKQLVTPTKKTDSLCYADIASAVKAAKIDITSRKAVLDFVTGIYERSGRKDPNNQAYQFWYQFRGNKDRFNRLSYDGNIENIKQYLPESIKTIDDVAEAQPKKVEQQPEPAESLNKVSITEKERLEMVKESAPTISYADIAAAVVAKDINVKDRKGLNIFVYGIYKRTGISNDKAQNRAYQFMHRVKNEKDLQQLNKKGDISNIAKYLKESPDVEERAEEAAQTPEPATPEPKYHKPRKGKKPSATEPSYQADLQYVLEKLPVSVKAGLIGENAAKKYNSGLQEISRLRVELEQEIKTKLKEERKHITCGMRDCKETTRRLEKRAEKFAKLEELMKK